MLTGRPSDDRPTCPPPISAERARQNVPSASSYMPLKHSRSHRSSGSNDQETGSSSTQSGSQRAYDNESRMQSQSAQQRKQVSHSFQTSVLSSTHAETILEVIFTVYLCHLVARPVSRLADNFTAGLAQIVA